MLRIFYPTTTEYTYFSSAHGTLTKTEILLGHKDNLTNLRESIQSVYSDHNEIKLEINNRKKTRKKFLNI